MYNSLSPSDFDIKYLEVVLTAESTENGAKYCQECHRRFRFQIPKSHCQVGLKMPKIFQNVKQ